MDKTVFADIEADPKWWLVQPELEYGLTELRKDISENVGWGRDDQWFLEKWKVEELYDLIEGKSFSLLQELDDATDDYKRQEWITKVVELTRPAAEEPAVEHIETPAAPIEPAGPPTESAAPPSEPAAPPSEPAAAPKPSIFQKKAPEVPGDAAAALTAAVKQVMAHIEPDNLPALASELGVTEQELAELVRDLPSDFESLVAAEAAKLAAATSTAQ